MKVSPFVILLLVAFVMEVNGAKSSSKSSSSSSSSGSSSRGSSSKGSSSGGFGSIFGGSKSSSSSSSGSSGASYPKQTWSATNTGSSYPKQTGTNQASNAGASYPKQTWSNTGTHTGTNTGYNTGTHTGTNTGYNTGTHTGYNTGTNTGYNTGTNTGYNTGGTYAKQPGSNPYLGTNQGNQYGQHGQYGQGNQYNQQQHYGGQQGGQYGGQYGQGNYQGNQYGGQHYGGNQYGGNQYGGNQYGGNQYGGQHYGGNSGYNYQNTGQRWSNPNVGRNYGYYGAGGQSIFGNQQTNYNYRKSPFGGFSGAKGLAVGGAAGFAGGAIAGASAVTVYHQYKQYKGLMHCRRYGCGDYRPYGGYGGGYGYNRGVLLNHQDCYGGCPNQAYCDYGICRCREGYESRYGQCWNSIDSFNSRQRDWDVRVEKNYNPFHKCSESKNCYDVDMNLICRNGTCGCRDEMKWNDEVSECQIFIDVDCTGVIIPEEDFSNSSISEQPRHVNSSFSESNTDDLNMFHNSSDSSGNETSWDASSLALFANETSDEMLNETHTEERQFDKVINVTSLTADETLKDSDLTKIDPAKSSEKQIKEAFCREISRTAKRYAPPKEVELEPLSTTAKAVIIVICVLIGLSCCFCCIKSCIVDSIKRRRDQKLEQFERVLPLAVMESALQDNESMQPMLQQVPYAPGPDNPNPNFQPPPGIYPQIQGGPEGPYPGPGMFPQNDPGFQPGPGGPGFQPGPGGPGFQPGPGGPGFQPGPGGPGFPPGPDGMGYPQGPGGPGFPPGPGGPGYPQGPGGPGYTQGPGGMIYPPQ